MRQERTKSYRLSILFSGTLAMAVVMAKTGATLKTPYTTSGIIDLEFAYNASKAGTIITAWKELMPVDHTFIAIINTWLDFIFLLFYALFLYHACIMLASKSRGGLQKTGIFLAKCALAAGVLDILENIGMLITLNGHLSDTTTMLTFIFSISKWILVLAAVLYLLTAVAWLLYKKIKQNPAK